MSAAAFTSRIARRNQMKHEQAHLKLMHRVLKPRNSVILVHIVNASAIACLYVPAMAEHLKVMVSHFIISYY
jgi:hypothetical protein